METSWLHARDSPDIIASPNAAPFTTLSLTANLVLRVTLAITANIVCIVPLRLLYKNGEFAAAVFIVNVEIKNLLTVIYSLIWRNDNMEAWWPGYGLCDVHPYIYNVSLSLFVTCLLAIMRNLAHQVSMLRANPLTVREKRRRNLIQALIMFPLPVIQVALTWPLTLQRYVVGTLVGCTWLTYPAWPYLVFFVIAPVAVAVITGVYAVLTYFRFRQVARNTRSALSSNRSAIMRAQRTRRRLYLMVISILTPFLPMVCTLAVLNILHMRTVLPFDYNVIHNHTQPYSWNTILFVSSKDLDFSFLNNAYISILAAIPIFVFFGMTKDAINDYRQVLLALGIGRFSTRLHHEYDPDKPADGGSSVGSSQFLSSNSASTSKFRSTSISHPLTAMRSSARACSTIPPLTPLDALTPFDLESGSSKPPRRSQATCQMLPEEDFLVQRPVSHPNPFLFRTRFDFPSRLYFPLFNTKQKKEVVKIPAVPLQHLQSTVPRNWNPHAENPQVHTRVWSEDEVALCTNPTNTASAASVDSIQGVMVETALTRETHHAGIYE